MKYIYIFRYDFENLKKRDAEFLAETVRMDLASCVQAA